MSMNPDDGNEPKRYDPRPPQDRRVAGEDPDAPRRRRRRSRDGGNSSGENKASFMGRLTGRAEMERAKAKRYDPYTYDSNNTQLKFVIFALVVWTVLALLIAWQDRATAATLDDIRNQGFNSVPPSQFSATGILEFAEREGVACNTNFEIQLLSPECSRLINAQAQYGAVKDVASIYTVLLVATLLGCMFAFGSFTHRASRNLLTLKSEGQRFKPENAVIWFFVPVINLFRPWQVFRELFRGSDPDVTTSDPLLWKTKGKIPAIVNIWAGIFVAVFFFNPRSIGWFWYSVRNTFDDVIVAHQRLVIADILLAVLGISAIFVAIELNRRQEARHAKVGDITVTPPRPVDPLEEALKEGIRRKELETQRRQERESN